MITHVVGDLLLSNETHIAHGCNTAGVMGAGIAQVIAESYPVVRHQYQRRCVKHEFVLGSAFPVVVPQRTIWNLGTQRAPGANATLWGIMLSFGNMFEQMVEWDVRRVGIPRLGAGIGGLRWADVERTIAQVQQYVPDAPEVVVYTQESQVNKPW
jgi:O-acetyl-ADP-ribose deacetylase (regulator of RNase III)